MTKVFVLGVFQDDLVYGEEYNEVFNSFDLALKKQLEMINEDLGSNYKSADEIPEFDDELGFSNAFVSGGRLGDDSGFRNVFYEKYGVCHVYKVTPYTVKGEEEKKNKIVLPTNQCIIAEKGDPDHYEMFVGLESANGKWFEDLVCVEYKDGKICVLVADPKTGDFVGDPVLEKHLETKEEQDGNQ